MEAVQFKDGTHGLPPFDRLVHFDERSKGHRVFKTPSDILEPRNKTWQIVKHLDQGREGACVGAGITQALIADPVCAFGLDMPYAKKRVYWPAQLEDPWPGSSMPGDHPFYEGTAVVAGLEIVRKLGWIDSYKWVFSFQEFCSAMSYAGPAVMGLKMREGMMEIDRDGFLRPIGEVIGGHCLVCKGIDVQNQLFILHNSWGDEWGISGDCYVSFEDMEKMLADQGEAAFFMRKIIGGIR